MPCPTSGSPSFYSEPVSHHTHEYIDVDRFQEYEDFPLTQLSEKSWWCPPPETSIKLEDDTSEASRAKNVKAWAHHNAFGAPPSPQGAAVSQELDDLPNPFQGEAESSNRPPICAACGVAVAKDPKKKAMRGVHCDVCGIHLHLHCADLLFPPRHASWACMGCR